MTIKQRDYILGLDKTLLDYAQYCEPEKYSQDILGKNWLKRYLTIPHQDASRCITILQEECVKCGCYDSWDQEIKYDYYD